MSDTPPGQQVDYNGVLRGPLDRHTDARLDILYLDDHRIDRVGLPAHRPGRFRRHIGPGLALSATSRNRKYIEQAAQLSSSSFFSFGKQLLHTTTWKRRRNAPMRTFGIAFTPGNKRWRISKARWVSEAN
jgi:hypothetical protein